MLLVLAYLYIKCGAYKKKGVCFRIMRDLVKQTIQDAISKGSFSNLINDINDSPEQFISYNIYEAYRCMIDSAKFNMCNKPTSRSEKVKFLVGCIEPTWLAKYDRSIYRECAIHMMYNDYDCREIISPDITIEFFYQIALGYMKNVVLAWHRYIKDDKICIGADIYNNLKKRILQLLFPNDIRSSIKIKANLHFLEPLYEECKYVLVSEKECIYNTNQCSEDSTSRIEYDPCFYFNMKDISFLKKMYYNDTIYPGNNRYKHIQYIDEENNTIINMQDLFYPEHEKLANEVYDRLLCADYTNPNDPFVKHMINIIIPNLIYNDIQDKKSIQDMMSIKSLNRIGLSHATLVPTFCFNKKIPIPLYLSLFIEDKSGAKSPYCCIIDLSYLSLISTYTKDSFIVSAYTRVYEDFTKYAYYIDKNDLILYDDKNLYHFLCRVHMAKMMYPDNTYTNMIVNINQMIFKNIKHNPPYNNMEMIYFVNALYQTLMYKYEQSAQTRRRHIKDESLQYSEFLYRKDKNNIPFHSEMFKLLLDLMCAVTSNGKRSFKKAFDRKAIDNIDFELTMYIPSNDIIHDDSYLSKFLIRIKAVYHTKDSIEGLAPTLDASMHLIDLDYLEHDKYPFRLENFGCSYKTDQSKGYKTSQNNDREVEIFKEIYALFESEARKYYDYISNIVNDYYNKILPSKEALSSSEEGLLALMIDAYNYYFAPIGNHINFQTLA